MGHRTQVKAVSVCIAPTGSPPPTRPRRSNCTLVWMVPMGPLGTEARVRQVATIGSQVASKNGNGHREAEAPIYTRQHYRQRLLLLRPMISTRADNARTIVRRGDGKLFLVLILTPGISIPLGS